MSSLCDGDCYLCGRDFNTCPLTRNDDHRFKKDTQPETRKEACPICHSDLVPVDSGVTSKWCCVLCGYETNESGDAPL